MGEKPQGVELGVCAEALEAVNPSGDVAQYLGRNRLLYLIIFVAATRGAVLKEVV